MTTKTNASATKLVKTRDAATAILRKLGVDKKDYNKRLTKTDEGFIVALKQVTTKTTRSSEALGREGTLSYEIRRRILAGESNREILEALCTVGQLDASKQKHYPAWYRGELRRAGHKV